MKLHLRHLSAPAPWLRRYFSSGWAFLIPYLAAYLLYYWLKWPVNPADAGVKVRVASESGTWVPCLLHVYWLLHAINLVLGAFALRAWWRKEQEKGERRTEAGDRSQETEVRSQESEDGRPISDHLTQRREDAKEDTSALSLGPEALSPGTPTARGNIASQKAPPVPFPSLPPVKWLRLRFFRFLDFTISRSSSRFQLSAVPSASLPPSDFRLSTSLLPSPFSLLLQRLAPWFLLALVFYIPGVYLEWPADPWDHYARINEWSWLHLVGEHWAWAKSSYFLAYSFLGQISPPTRQLFWLDFYYTGCCLLLCWQYYRLARAVGLGERASMLFVILQTVLFGNNIFGFYRYYGISSSIFAQIGAVALTRVAIEYASQKFQVPKSKDQGASTKAQVPRTKRQGTDEGISQEEREITENPDTEQISTTDENGLSRIGNVPAFARLCAFLRLKKSAQPAAHRSVACEQAPTVFRFPAFPLFLRPPFSALPSPFSLLQAGASVFALLLLIAFNHVQGLGIAGLGLLAVAIWRLIDWKRSMAWWLAGAAAALSVAAVLWYPRISELDSCYVPSGWLTHWYGFNVFSIHAEAGDRTRQIIGLLGLLNLIAGLTLLRRNHLAGWLTLTPLIALSLPFIAIPFAGALAQHGSLINIITFQRMLFAIPPSLALVALGELGWQGARSKKKGRCSMELTKPTAPGLVFQSPSSVLPDASALSPALPPSVPPRFSFSARFPGFSVSRFPGLLISCFSAPLLRSPFSLLLVALTALLLVPANRPFYNRFWQALAMPPDDLQLKPVVSATESAAIRLHDVKPLKLGTTPGVAYALSATFPQYLPRVDRNIGQSTVERLNHSIATALLSRPLVESKCPTLTHDPFAVDPASWTIFAGSPPEFVSGMSGFPPSSTALQNSLGRRSDVFTSELIPIDPAQDYGVEVSVRQAVVTKGTVYLVIAWYDKRGQFLPSNAPPPAGAGDPAGWNNGTYSYFGLAGDTAPTTWTTYRKSFGFSEATAIPSNAKFVRVGALLNYNTTPAATVQLTNVRLWQKTETEMVVDGVFSNDEHLFIIAPPCQMLWTYASQAAQASRHWPAQEVAADLSGGAELAAAARAAGAKPVDRDTTTFELIEIPDSPARVP